MTRDEARLPTLSVPDTARVARDVVGWTIGRGVIIRRPGAVNLAERLQADERAVKLLGRLRERYGPGPLRLNVPVRELALVLDPADLTRILEENPRPFTPASREKRAALRHFEPRGVLVSDEQDRAVRRPFNEAVLDADTPAHRLHPHIEHVVAEEVDALREGDVIDWETFSDLVWRVGRRVILGDAARDEDRITVVMAQLRAQANWAFARPRSARRLAELEALLAEYVSRADPQSLAGVVAATPAPRSAAAIGQMPQWLFAYDAAGIAAFRALALVSSAPDVRTHIASEQAVEGVRPWARAAMLESLRLWPTTLAILRDSVEETRWRGHVAPAGTGFIAVSSYFHRDRGFVPWADSFEPAAWLDGRSDGHPTLVPFSAGPARCPGRTIVLGIAGELLGALVQRRSLRPSERTVVDLSQPVPHTFSHARLRFLVAR